MYPYIIDGRPAAFFGSLHFLKRYFEIRLTRFREPVGQLARRAAGHIDLGVISVINQLVVWNVFGRQLGAFLQ